MMGLVFELMRMENVHTFLEQSDDDEESELNLNSIENIVYIPPPAVDNQNDEEQIDDNIITGVDLDALCEIAGEVEVEYTSLNDFAAPLLDTATKQTISSFQKPKWKKTKITKFRNHHNATALFEKQNELIAKLSGKNVVEYVELFLDDEVINYIVEQTNIYAHQNNVGSDVCNKTNIVRFIGFLLLTGYHTVPQVELYWSNKSDLGVPIVQQAFSRAQFRTIKKYIHLANNETLNSMDRFAEVIPLINLMNKKFMQFGIFEEHISIDEQMVPYFGRHSCKMFVRSKPIRFGFKIWALASSDGYIFNTIPYAGASQPYDKKLGLGAHVVLELLKNVENPQHHLVNLTTVTTVVTWQGNATVTVVTNFELINPLGKTRRYNRKEHKFVHINQPIVIKNYNSYMGGVDMADNGISSYRINARGKNT
ncbi:piggyBac transposable element-derived protein 3-like [Teleopsis dalmanni]|uniref:piggyBac transposable element-derived protein 3-like n=1 Tax=Teleopsis dalmanni TaxID=139649 RepID=UPI0018CFAD5B|nr:piggyBac transposable element-derived protein 3-like [Teleopsis dalmanni]